MAIALVKKLFARDQTMVNETPTSRFLGHCKWNTFEAIHLVHTQNFQKSNIWFDVVQYFKFQSWHIQCCFKVHLSYSTSRWHINLKATLKQRLNVYWVNNLFFQKSNISETHVPVKRLSHVHIIDLKCHFFGNIRVRTKWMMSMNTFSVSVITFTAKTKWTPMSK